MLALSMVLLAKFPATIEIHRDQNKWRERSAEDVQPRIALPAGTHRLEVARVEVNGDRGEDVSDDERDQRPPHHPSDQ